MTLQTKDAKIIQCLSEAFSSNRSVNWVIRKSSSLRRIEGLIRYSLAVCRKRGGIFYSDNDEGVLLYDCPNSGELSFLASTLLEIRLVLGVIGIKRLPLVMKREAFIHKYHPKSNFIYLWFIGVTPDQQGKGIGGKLMERLVRLADEKKLPIYLETSAPENLPFYRRHGFEVYKEWNADFIGFPIWMMKRDKGIPSR